jgi:hypothetical protein
MEVKFHVDPDTNEPHIAGHGVEEWEAFDVLLNAEMD